MLLITAIDVVEVDADKFVQGILRHDEDTRVDGVLVKVLFLTPNKVGR